VSPDESPDPGKRIAIRYLVRGRVQGVGFRWWTRERARQLNVTGSVRNRRDGSVEITAVGHPSELEKLEQQLAVGPQGSRVDSIDGSRVNDVGHSDAFLIES
jgi:acylphosphatase